MGTTTPRMRFFSSRVSFASDGMRIDTAARIGAELISGAFSASALVARTMVSMRKCVLQSREFCA